MRAFLNGQLNLAQAEAVSDLISAENEAQHRLAMQQMRGGYSKELEQLRAQLIEFAALIELELDFGEEDVEFANRDDLRQLVERIQEKQMRLLRSFRLGNAIKQGVPVAIAGRPNAGKSTLLNALFNEEKAIVSPIAGTTRDVIEDTLHIGGLAFRLMDTAGLRETDDLVEQIGVQRARDRIRNAQVLLYMVDGSNLQGLQDLEAEETEARAFGVPYLLLLNKTDIAAPQLVEAASQWPPVVPIAARQSDGIEQLKSKLLSLVQTTENQPGDIILSNIRHAEALQRSTDALMRVQEGLHKGITGDFLAMDIRYALRELGSITGAVDVDRDILGTIFGKFCIGK
jgi:tRNA modification GTPase